ncbi:MAG: DUF4340 domain-containing protein [Desmonostoc vinosum HA7617-LM4]|jgi:hypothetical protein|nr:DUF4340 domain-containing protein [Desmonostoc vinosum HA7617-LM4]
MKLPRTTLILISLALGLGGFVYFYEIQGKTRQEEIKEKQQQVFSFTEEDIQSLMIKTQNMTLSLERSSQTENPKWLIKSPISQPANDAIVSYLTDLLVKGKSDRILSTPANRLGEFGLDKPQATINITLKNQKSHQLLLGKRDFSRSSLYAQTDPANQQNVNVLLVSTDFENAVNRELSEWKQPIKSIEKLPPLTVPQPTPTR